MSIKSKDSVALERRNLERYRAVQKAEILREEDDSVIRAKMTSTVKQWCLENGVDSLLLNWIARGLSSRGYVAEFRTFSYQLDGRLTDAEITDLRKKLKKAPFKYQIQGVE